MGVDIGGSGIKGAVVDLDEGVIPGDRYKIETPQPATPERIAETVGRLATELSYTGPVGIGFPAIVAEGFVWTANNIDETWVGVDAVELFKDRAGLEVAIINDADAAALGEARYGAARDTAGLAIVLTFGSGIGSGFLVNGELVRNVELGGLELEGHSRAEFYFSAMSRKRDGLSWDEWGVRANRFLTHVNLVFSPSLIAVAGGAARRWDRWSHLVDSSLPVVRARFANNAGIVGAATLVGSR